MKTPMVLLAVIALGSLSSTPAVSQTPVKLVLSGGVPVVEGIFLNGSGPYRFLLDTGSQTNQLDPALADQLGVKPAKRIRLYTPSGASGAVAGFIDTVTLGSMQATHQEFLLIRLDAVRRHCPGVQGIVGQEFLAHFDYLLDFRHHRMMQAEPPSTGYRIPTRLAHGTMVVSTSRGDLVLDSGAETMLLYRTTLLLPATAITTAEGSVLSVATESQSSVTIGDRSYLVAKTNFVAAPRVDEAGYLPASLFQALYVCNSGSYLILDPKIPG